jgi:hypothetical protein
MVLLAGLQWTELQFARCGKSRRKPAGVDADAAAAASGWPNRVLSRSLCVAGESEKKNGWSGAWRWGLGRKKKEMMLLRLRVDLG